mmetsp:Transcript_32102/g.62767  ORF Transcript_32102/g.62767 Transcript_32102/m.62767 type:complete len:109 (+) Transcript_32102:339-665(+)
MRGGRLWWMATVLQTPKGNHSEGSWVRFGNSVPLRPPHEDDFLALMRLREVVDACKIRPCSRERRPCLPSPRRRSFRTIAAKIYCMRAWLNSALTSGGQAVSRGAARY